MDKNMEFNNIDALLPSVWNDGLLTDIECRKIASSKKPNEKIDAVYEIIKSKMIPEASDLIQKFDLFRNENFKALLSEIEHHECNCDSDCNCNFISAETDNNCDFDSQCASECDSDCKCEVKKSNPKTILVVQKNPFLQTVVIECLLGYLTVEEIKNARLVCRSWNSTSELILRKRSAVYFRPNIFRPADFLAVLKYSLVEVPFPSFKFDECSNSFVKEEANKSWRVSEIQNFLEEWGKNIQELSLMRLHLVNGRLHFQFDVTPWFVNLSNLTNLKIECESENPEFVLQTSVEISLGPLASINTISLANCNVLTYTGKEITHISPSNICMINIRLKRDGEELDFSYNDFIDFSQIVNAMMNNDEFGYHSFEVTFDMGRHIFKANQIHLLNVDVKNWRNAKGEIHHLHLYYSSFTTKNQLQIKQLNCENSDIDLCILPKTIEKISLSRGTIFCRRPVQLENLNFLRFHVSEDNSKNLLHFGNCANLVELELISDMGESNDTIIHLECIPRSIQKCRIYGLQFTFSSNDCIWEVETLILEECGDDGPLLIDCRYILAQIKPKNLVLIYSGEIEVDTSDVMKFVVENQQVEKVIIGSRNSDWDLQLHQEVPFEVSLMSLSVGEKSNYYLFENQLGQAITFSEFKEWTKMNDLDDYFYG